MTLNRTQLAAIAASCLAIVLLIAGVWAVPPFSPDSWAYYEMTQNRVPEIQSLGNQRTFLAEGPAVSFPPAWPILWKVSDALFRQGARSGLIAAGLAFMVLVLLSGAISNRVIGSYLPGTLAALLLLAHPGFRSEVLAARSIPLAMCFFVIIVYLLFFTRLERRSLFLSGVLGLLAGAAVMTRFDYFSLLVVSGIAVLVYQRSLTHLLAFSGASLIVLSPWVVMSLVHYGAPFATDNGWVALSAESTSYVTDWPAEARRTVSSHPIEWALLNVRRAPSVVWSAVNSPRESGLISLTLAIASFYGVSTAFRWRRRGATSATAKPNVATSRLIAAATFATGFVALKALALLATGYTDGRYFSEAYLAFMFALVTAAFMIASRKSGAAAVSAGMAAAIISVAIYLSVFVHDSYDSMIGSLSPTRSQVERFPRLIEVEEVLDACASTAPGKRVLFWDSNVNAARISATTQYLTAMMPRNLELAGYPVVELRRFLDEWGIGFVFGDVPASHVRSLNLVVPSVERCVGAGIYAIR